ncbi:glycosyltransferase [Bartonella sp. LJL80]
MNTIGIYVHHHGDGHRQRALSIAQQAPDQFTLLGTNLKGRTGRIACLDLPDDSLAAGMGFPAVPTHPSLHYAPLHHDGLRKRNRMICEWIEVTRPSLMLVDVSVEIATLASLNGLPFIYTRLSGERRDTAHESIFRAAAGLLCPFHSLLDAPDTEDWIKIKSVYFSGLSQTLSSFRTIAKSLLVVLGRGGHSIDLTNLAEMASELTEWRIDVIGPLDTRPDLPTNLHIHGWVDQVGPYIARANVVVGACGDGLLGDVTALGKPFIALPQARPFGEQHEKARRLAEIHAAITCEAWPASWRTLLEKAKKLGSSIVNLHDESGPRHASDYLLSMAHQYSVDMVSLAKVRTL